MPGKKAQVFSGTVLVVGNGDRVGFRHIANPVTYDDNNIIPLSQRFNTENEDIRYSLEVDDQSELKFLNEQLKNGEVTEVYRAMQLVNVNGKEVLVPPMAGKVKNANGKWVWQNPSKLNVWEKSEEITDFEEALRNGTIEPTKYEDGRDGYKFKLKKGQTGMTDVPAAYNPYIHTSLSTLNDQFTSAYKRSNLVIVKGYVPNSEIYGDPRINGELYGAEYAKDKVGRTKWHSGVVAAKMPETREVILSRYFMPVEILDNEAVAKKIKEQMGGRDIEIPFNVVSPGLRRALENEGVRIGEGQGLANLPSKESVKYSLHGTYDSVNDMVNINKLTGILGGYLSGNLATYSADGENVLIEMDGDLLYVGGSYENPKVNHVVSVKGIKHYSTEYHQVIETIVNAEVKENNGKKNFEYRRKEYWDVLEQTCRNGIEGRIVLDVFSRKDIRGFQRIQFGKEIKNRSKNERSSYEGNARRGIYQDSKAGGEGNSVKVNDRFSIEMDDYISEGTVDYMTAEQEAVLNQMREVLLAKRAT